MENKKLIKILLKDMGELQELIAEVKTKGSFNSFEIEFLQTRAKGIMQLLQMLNGFDAHETVKIEEPETNRIIQEEFKPEATVSEKTETTDVEKTKVIDKEPETETVKLEEDKIQEEVTEFEAIEEISEPEIPEPVKVQEEIPEEITEEKKEIPVSGEVELEEEEQVETDRRLGDSFLKGKSVNDIIEDQNKLEFKLSNRPVESIQTAIGINDRFQYIRELFDGKPEKFKETVSSIDSMNNIQEAVVFLQQNFKWKKNETSLKFVNLVKRRFAND